MKTFFIYTFYDVPRYILTIGWGGVLLEKRQNLSDKWQIILRIGFKELEGKK